MTSAPDRQIRVLFVTGAYYPEFSAGGLQCRAVAKLLQGRARVTVLTTATDRSLPRHAVIDGVPVSRVFVTLGSRRGAIHAVWGLLTELRRLVPQVDLVHVQGYSSKNILIAAIARLFARPVLLHLQTAKHDEPATVAAHGRLAWWSYASAAAFLSVSPGLTARYLEAGLPPAKVRGIPNGVDDARFSPATVEERAALRAQLNLPPDRPLVVCVGLVSPDKQPHVLLDAWLRLQNDPSMASTLVFVGATDPTLFELGGRLIDQLRATAQSSGFADRVVFVPPTNRVQDYFRAADVYAMPSLREGLPIALLEAMACGLPCVASNLPGSTDVMIEDGVSGHLVPPGDAGRLAQALRAVLADPAGAARMGAAARATIEARFTMTRVADQWLAVYHEVLATS